MAETIYIATDHTATFGVLKDQDGNAVTDAEVTATLLDKNSMPLTDQIVPFPLTFTDAGSGNYTAHIPYDHGLVLGSTYFGRFKAVANDIQREWDSQFTVARGKI